VIDRTQGPTDASRTPSHWDILGLPKGGSARLIEEAFRARMNERRRSGDRPDLADLFAARDAALRETGDFAE
jgi:hypothetical protein